ncbi:hypothetical protein NP493_1181g00027 [Ridgeia piscesae]|uniref:Fucosyltransferase n=1 Tax=Ridgeia piscesae TaxID=27915 RepID=A0AAD9KEB5_RIDPI|nr:hypothetical protein NP493_1181g00027 [Ridgeia piscesae]
MTYKRASDVTWFYGECRRKNTKPATSHVKYNYADGKKHLIAWFVSNCNTQSRRERYVRELARHVDVHKFGCGGKFSCPRTKHKYCDTVLLHRTYKFYLSFENSLCPEYVTEKLYRILNLNVVPIVLGYSNYSAFLPPHSFIDVRDFDSPKKLAAYLTMLNENDTENDTECISHGNKRTRARPSRIGTQRADCVGTCKDRGKGYKWLTSYSFGIAIQTVLTRNNSTVA